MSEPSNNLETAVTEIGIKQCPECLRREQKFKERPNFKVGYLLGGKCDRCVYRAPADKEEE